MVQLVNPLFDAARTIGGPQRGFAALGEGSQEPSLFNQVAGQQEQPGGFGGFAEAISAALPPPIDGEVFVPGQSLPPGAFGGGASNGAASGGSFLDRLASNDLFVSGLAGLSGGNPLQAIQQNRAAEAKQQRILFELQLLRREEQRKQQIFQQGQKIRSILGGVIANIPDEESKTNAIGLFATGQMDKLADFFAKREIPMEIDGQIFDPAILSAAARAAGAGGLDPSRNKQILEQNGIDQREIADPRAPALLSPEELDQRVKPARAGRPASTTNVTTKLPAQEGAFDKRIGGAFAAELVDFRQKGRAARKQNNNLSALTALAKTTRTGQFAPTKLSVKRAIQAVGLDPAKLNLADDTAAAEAIVSLASEATLGNVSRLTGQISEKELSFLTAITPGLSTSPPGIKLIAEINQRINDRAIEESDAAVAYARANKGRLDLGFDDILGEISSQPMFDDRFIRKATEIVAGRPDRTAATGAGAAGGGLSGNNPLDAFQAGIAVQTRQREAARQDALRRQEARERQVLGAELTKIAARSGNQRLKRLVGQGPAAYGEAIKLVNLMGAAQEGQLTAEQEAELFGGDPGGSSGFERFELVTDRLGRVNRIGIRDGGATAVNLGPVDGQQGDTALEGEGRFAQADAAARTGTEVGPTGDTMRQAQSGRGQRLASDAFDPLSPDQPLDMDLDSLGAFMGEAGLQALGGLFDALENAADQLEQAVPLGTFDIVDGRIVHRAVDPAAERGFPSVAPAETTGGDIVRGVSQFLTGFFPAFKGAQLLNLGRSVEKGATALGAGRKLASLAGTTAEAEAAAVAGGQIAFDPKDPNLANLLSEHTGLRHPVLEFLATDPNDNEAENRLNNALVDLGLGVFIAPLVEVLKGFRPAREFRSGPARQTSKGEALENFEQIGDQTRTGSERDPSPPTIAEASPVRQRNTALEGEIRPASDLPAYVDSVVKSNQRPPDFPRFLFDTGIDLPEQIIELAAATRPQFGGLAGHRILISNEVVDKLFKNNPKEADRLLAELPDLLTAPREVLPDHQNQGRILVTRPFIGQSGKPTNQVGVLEIAVTKDGMEVVSIHVSPDRTLRKARMLLRRLLGLDDSGNGVSGG